MDDAVANNINCITHSSSPLLFNMLRRDTVIMKVWVWVWVWVCCVSLSESFSVRPHVDSFSFGRQQPQLSLSRTLRLRTGTHRLSPLMAVKKKKKAGKPKGTGGSTSGFGGAAMEACACGSGQAYVKCCGRLHKDPAYYAQATAEQVVRARYTAYAKRVIDFIIDSTHPLNHNFMEDIDHWRETIAMNCYDNFELTKCDILKESYHTMDQKEIAIVQFMAHMTQRDLHEKTAFCETSSFERHPDTGAWLYRNGVVEAVPTNSTDTIEENHQGDEDSTATD